MCNPLGDVSKSSIRDANSMVSRVCLLLLLASSRQCKWLLEQPSTSLLSNHPRFRWLASRMEVWRMAFSMGAYGGPTRKQTLLYGNHFGLTQSFNKRWLGQKSAVATTHRYVDKHGVKRCTGTKFLKQTQCRAQVSKGTGASTKCLRGYHRAKGLPGRVCYPAIVQAGLATLRRCYPPGFGRAVARAVKMWDQSPAPAPYSRVQARLTRTCACECAHMSAMPFRAPVDPSQCPLDRRSLELP